MFILEIKEVMKVVYPDINCGFLSLKGWRLFRLSANINICQLAHRKHSKTSVENLFLSNFERNYIGFSFVTFHELSALNCGT